MRSERIKIFFSFIRKSVIECLESQNFKVLALELAVKLKIKVNNSRFEVWRLVGMHSSNGEVIEIIIELLISQTRIKHDIMLSWVELQSQNRSLLLSKIINRLVIAIQSVYQIFLQLFKWTVKLLLNSSLTNRIFSK